MNNQKRSSAADIIRCFAFFCVVSVHFFLNNGFYSQVVLGERMLIMTLMRSFFIICVPLFLILSGYLLRKKELSGRYYKRIFKIFLTYILSSILCMVFSVVFLHQELTLKDIIFKLLDFSGAPYSWYIEMYIGLFLIIPFLNTLYNNIPTKGWKLGLIIVFIILTSLPSVINVYNFSSASWWGLPSSSGEYNKLIPSWWSDFYPITYYFIGCYLSEYGFKIKRFLNFVLIILFTLISGLYTYWRSYKVSFIWGSWCAYNSLFNIILTSLVFIFIINLNYDKFPRKLSLLLKEISGLCLGGYLLSWIFDSLLYPILLKKVPTMTLRLEYYFIIVPTVFVLSLVLSYFVSKIQLFMEFVFLRIKGLIRKNNLKIAE